MASAAEMLAKIKATRSQYARNDNKIVKLKEGKTRVRILQKPGEFKFWHDLGVHWIKQDVNTGKPLAVVGDTDATFDEPSRINALIEKVIMSAPDDETANLAKSWKAKRSVLVCALIRSGDAKSETPVPLELTRTTFDMVLSLFENFVEENDGLSMLDPEAGIDVIIERKGKGLDTEYSVQPSSKSQPVPKAALDAFIDLEGFIRREFFKTGEEQKALTAIERISGVSSGLIGGPSRTAGLLTGAKVVDADLDEDIVEELAPKTKPAPKAAAKPAAKKEAAKPAPVEDDFDDDIDVSDALDELDGLDEV